MHVLFLPSWYPSHRHDVAGSFFREQGHALRRAGVKVGVIAPRVRSIKQPNVLLKGIRKISLEDDDAVVTVRGNFPNLTPRMWFVTRFTYGLFVLGMFDRYVEQNGMPDIVHVHSALPGGIGAMAIQKKYSIPYVLSEHSTAFARGLVNDGGRTLTKEIAERSAACFAVSAVFARKLEQILTVREGLFSYVHNSVSDIFLTNPLPKTASGRFRFLHVSSLTNVKRVDLLLNAFAERFRGNPDVSLTIGGQGALSFSLKALSEELGVADQVEFTGPLLRHEVAEHMAKSSAFVLPSDFETFGVVLIEALAMGLPVIATRSGGPEDIITDDYYGLLVPKGDVSELGMAMEKMIKMLPLRNPEKIRNDCLLRFGTKKITRDWIAIYSNAI
ncbi:MAG: glycosyltransferase [Pseudomonadota bacterium]